MSLPAPSSTSKAMMLPFGLAGVTLLLVLGAFVWSNTTALQDQNFQAASVGAQSGSKYTKVAKNSVLRFMFTEKMNIESVKKFIQIPESLAGEFAMQDDVLTFVPNSELHLGTSYTFTIETGALRDDGRPLSKPLSFVFSVEGPPKIASRVPAPQSVHIPTDATITIIFDRPMVPLASVYEKKDQQLADWPVAIDPPIQGTWRWLGTSTVEFRPTGEFMPAMHYDVSVPAGITNPSGDATAEDFSWSFETVHPKVLSSDPYNNFEEAGKDTHFELQFNLEMDVQILQKYLSLQKKNAEDQLPFALHYGKKTNENNIQIDDRTRILVIPNSPLVLDTEYILTVTKDARAAQGNLGTEEEFVLNIKTAGAFYVISHQDYPQSVNFQLSNPYSGDQLKEHIRVNPPIDDWADRTYEVDEWSAPTWLTVGDGLRPSTKYTMTLLKGLKDQFGQELAEDYSVEITTPELSPRVFIHSDGEFGIFEKDKPPVYFLNALNIANMEVDFAPLSMEQFLSIQAAKRSNYDYTPTLSGYSNYRHFSIPHTDKERNKWHVTEFDTQKELGALQPGLYAFTIASPQYVDWRGNKIIEQQYFSVTNMAVTLKYTGDSALVWVVDLQTGQPVTDAAVAFHALNSKIIVEGKTDPAGFFETELPLASFIQDNEADPEFWVSVSNGNDFTFVGNRWDQGVRAYDYGYWDDFQYANQPEYRAEVYMYTDRPLYRAGHTVNFKGVVRLRDSNGALHPPLQKRSVEVKIRDAQDKEIYSETLPFTAFGSFNGTLPIAEDGSLGTYYIQATVVPNDDIAYQYASQSFQVLAYRKPEYKTDITFQEDEYFRGDTVEATVEGMYYFGAPMEGAHVSWRAMTTDYYFHKYTDGYYSFSNESNWCWWDCEVESDFIAEGEGILNERGEFQVSFPYKATESSLSQVISIEADLEDANNQVVSNRNSVVMHNSDVYVGIAPESYGVEPGEIGSVQLVTVATDGSPVSNTNVTLKLYEREWNSIRKKGVDGDFYWDNQVKDTLVDQKNVKTGQDGKTVDGMVIPKGGSYQIVAEVLDNKGRNAVAGTSIYAYSSSYFNWPKSNSDRLEIIADKPEYSVGDTAKLIVKSPYQGKNVRALVTIERENIIRKFTVGVQSNAMPIEIPITEDLIPNAYVSVVIVKPRDGETFNNNGLDTGLPEFKMGLERLKVNTTEKELQVEITTDHKKYLPKQEVVVTIATKDYLGKPMPAEVSLSTVDMSVLALTGFEMPDLVRTFYTTRGLGVRTTHMLLYILERFKPGSKGGGGGDGDAFGKRGTFKDTAYWNPTILTDENGTATVKFTLPDNLTTWQLLAIANTKESKFGAEAVEVIETKNVIVRPVRPRFAVHRDEIELGAIVHNFMDTPQKFEVTLSGEGFSHQGNNTQTVTVQPDGQEKLSFPVTVEAVDKLALNFTAETKGARDEIEETIPVYLFSTPQSVATSGVTEESVDEFIYVPNRKNALELSLKATLSPTLATYIPAGLEYVSEFPYGCGEQIMSKLLPNIALQTLQGFEAFSYVPKDQLDKNVTEGVQKLYLLQRNDGGFGYWGGSIRSDTNLTAYIVFGLQKAKEAGYTIDAGVLRKAHTFLTTELRREPTDPYYVDDALRANILFVLAEGGTVDVNLLENLYDRREDLPLFAQAFYTMALQHADTSSLKKKAAALLTEMHNQVRVSPRGAHFEEKDARKYRWSMNTNDRTTALVLMATVRGDPANPLLARTVRYLLAIREQGHWDTTQSTSYTLLALTEFLKLTDELNADFTSVLTLGEKEVGRDAFTADNILTKKEYEFTYDDLTQEVLNLLRISKEGTGRVYYDLTMDYIWLADALPPVEEGMSITRTIEPFNPEEPDMVAGSTHKVTLTISVPDDRHFVGVESPLPAGFEAIDTSLKTSQQNLFEGDLHKETFDSWDDWWNSSARRFTHTEFRDDRVFLFADYLPTGVYKYEYMVRATTPGTYFERPARAWEMYFPENFGQTGGGKVVIK